MRLSLLTCFLRSFPIILVIFGLYSIEALGDSKEIGEKKSTFSGLTLPPISGKKPDSIVVLLHGYGDNAENFIFLAALLGQMLPNTLFVAPDAPIASKSIPGGRQWFSASSSNRPQLLKEIRNLTPALNQYIDSLLKTYNIPPEKLALFGFSQGARVALHVGLRRPQCAGIVAFSGSYLEDPLAANLSQPPILILHGVEDQRAPVSLARESYKQLETLRMPVSLVLMQGVGHDLDPQGLSIAGQFLKDCFEGKVVESKK